MIPALFYCADGNRKFAEIAIRRGYLYGAQLPNKVYYRPEFTDQDWRGFSRARTPEQRLKLRAAYMADVARYKPRLATVLDWEREDQFTEVMSWAEEAAQHVTEAVIVIPKVIGWIKRIPRRVNGVPIRLGYSAATTFSGTPVQEEEFTGRLVHCLGGGPARQMGLARRLAVESADGNYIQNMARRAAQFYSPAVCGKNANWPTLREAAIDVRINAPYIAFELTCIGVPLAWRGASSAEIWEAQLEFLKLIELRPYARQLRLWSPA